MWSPGIHSTSEKGPVPLAFVFVRSLPPDRRLRNREVEVGDDLFRLAVRPPMNELSGMPAGGQHRERVIGGMKSRLAFESERLRDRFHERL